MAEGRGYAEGQVVAKGRDWAEGQVASKGQVAAKGHVVAEGRAEGHVVAKGHVVSVDCFNDGFLYSLTKYSSIFAEVKGYFRIIGLNNQLVGMVWSCLRSLKCQHLQRADIEDGKLLLSSMRVRLCFVLSLQM